MLHHESMKYVRYESRGNTVGLDELIDAYWELDKKNEVIRCIEIKQDGTRLKYNQNHIADSHGQLPEGKITEENLSDKRYGVITTLTKDQFEMEWFKDAANYNNAT